MNIIFDGLFQKCDDKKMNKYNDVVKYKCSKYKSDCYERNRPSYED